MSHSTSKVVDPLRDLLGEVLLRLDILETKVGIATVSTAATTSTTSGNNNNNNSTNANSTTTNTTRNHYSLSSGSSHGTSSNATTGEIPASVKAYDDYIQATVVPFCTVCSEMSPDFIPIANAILRSWNDGIRTMIVLASRSKPPLEELKVPTDYVALIQPHIASTIQAVQEVRANVHPKMDRKFDIHIKAIYELITCVSWIYMYNAPSPHNHTTSLPIPFVKECMMSTVFWLNRIRKDHVTDSGGDVYSIPFCDTMKPIFTGLIDYITKYHATGLTFNPKGISLAEAAIRYTDEMATTTSIPAPPGTTATSMTTGTTAASANATAGTSGIQPDGDETITITTTSPKRTGPHPTLGSNVIVGGNVLGIIGELSKRTNADGSSAATGLKHVNKDQQTWRKEYKKDDGVALPAVPSLDASTTTSTTAGAAPVKKEKKKPLMGLPIFEYQDRGFKWVIENHTKESVLKEFSNGIISVDISDPKQQVYLYNCDGVTVQINGKFKSLVLDKCERCAVVYDTVISSAEMVNCKKIQLQVNGICPVFTIDKTVNVLIWLSAESAAITSFTTSLSSEMNISFPHGGDDDRKEVPIPEQFVHKLNTTTGSLSSIVSDLYN